MSHSDEKCHGCGCGGHGQARHPEPEATPAAQHGHGHGRRVQIRFRLNGVEREVSTAPMRRLLDVLRDDLGLTGTKEGCGEGECGACTVLLGGRPVNACLIPACQVEGAEIVTIEGLAEHPVLTPVQQAFVEHGGAQCGLCTPGMVMTASWIADTGQPVDAVARLLAGNLCRCTGYAQILEAVEAAVAGMHAAVAPEEP